MIDHRHAAIDTLTEFAEQFPNMTLGEIMYSWLRENNLGFKIEKPSDFIGIPDKQLYGAVEKAMKDERE